MPPDKSLFASKTFWANIIGPLAMLLGIFNIDLTPEEQQALIGAAVALQGGVNVVLRLMTKGSVRVGKGSTLQSSPLAGLLILALAGIMLAGCGAVGLKGETPREKDLVPIKVRREIQSVEQTTRSAILAYENAVRAGGGNTDALLLAASAAVVRLIETVPYRHKRLSRRWWPPDGLSGHQFARHFTLIGRVA